MKIEQKITNIIEGKRPAPVARPLLKAISEGYRSLVALRNLSYDLGLPQTKLPIPVISIGNIVAGGTGKTPCTLFLAQQFSPKQVAILSRGYKRKKKTPLEIEADTPYEDCGDEPRLLKDKLPNCRVYVAKNRASSGLLAVKEGAEILLLDDGMQHRKLYRSYDLVVVDAEDPFGKGHFLPRGYLRDSPKRLKKARLIFLFGIRDEHHFQEVERHLRPYTEAPLVAMQKTIENRVELSSKKVASFCAIASPHRFEKSIKSLGCDIVGQWEKPDHDPFFVEELQQFANRAKSKGAECLVCTEKDAVKLPKDLMLGLPLIPMRIALKPYIGKHHLDTFIQEVTP